VPGRLGLHSLPDLLFCQQLHVGAKFFVKLSIQTSFAEEISPDRREENEGAA